MDDSKIEDFLECSICLEQLDERSRVLPCQHTFCLKCLAIIVESKGHLQCPECRSDFQELSINDLPRNVLLVRILEGLKTKRRSTGSPPQDDNKTACVDKAKDRNSKRLSAKVKCDALLNQPSARGLYSFSSNEEGDLSFSKGDIITLLNEIDDNWLEGILKGKRGSIPKNFVETLVPLPKIKDDTCKTPFAKAVYTYASKEEPELISFKEGDIIRVIKKVDDNWLEGILGGQYGIFPVNFMKLNKAAQDVMSADSSSSGSGSSGSSSDDDNENKHRRKSRRATRAKKQTSRGRTTQPQSTQLRQQLSPNTQSNTDHSKRHTIHIENPNEQQRQSRRALNLSDELDQPQDRSRTQSQGRRASESSLCAQEPSTRSLASTVLLGRALRNSDDQLTCTIPSTVVPISMTSSISTRSNTSLTFSNAPSSNTPSPLGPGEAYTALFTYSPAQDDELALIQGDQYYVTEKHLDGWFKGVHVRSRQAGVFPGNYVKPTSQVTHQMMRNIASSPARNVIGYGSNPSSPTAIPCTGNAFSFPARGPETPESSGASCSSPRRNGDNSSPSRSSGFGLLKMLKKNKCKRPQAQPPTTTPPPPTTNTQSPPSYYHQSMPGPDHHRLSRPSPMVPAEPPPPYTLTPQDPVISNSNIPALAEKFRAIATYPANHETELSLRVGDVIYVTKKRIDGWFTGKSKRTGETGSFPSMFVEACY